MLPHGFRFNPTDEELIQILRSKVSGQELPHLHFIVEAHVYCQEPQHLQWNPVVRVNENEKYYFSKRVNESREVSDRGWWKATSHVTKIYENELLVGYKRPLTFHRYRENERNRNGAIKTNWIMHEFTLHSNPTEWRLCKIKYKGKPSVQEEMENAARRNRGTSSEQNHQLEEVQPLEYVSAMPNADSGFGPEFWQGMLEMSDELQQMQPQPSEIDYPVMNSSMSYVDDLEATHEEQFPSLWSWQH